jgi:hypothetical protein
MGYLLIVRFLHISLCPPHVYPFNLLPADGPLCLTLPVATEDREDSCCGQAGQVVPGWQLGGHPGDGETGH